MALNVTYTRPKVAEYQKEIMDCKERFALIEASTKAGKTTAMIIWLFEQALQCKKNQSVYWIAPVFAQAKIAFDRMKDKISNSNFFTANESRLTITLITGAIIEFKSGDNPDSLYGNDCYAAVIDEASRIKEQSWFAIRSTLTATNGKCKLIGNVKGRKNFFYIMAAEARSGLNKDYFYKKITAYDAVEAGILKLEEIENARVNLPENVFKEMFLAEASEDGSNPFGLTHIAGCVRPMSTERTICYGGDLAKSVDWTALVGLDRFANVSDFKHFQKPWGETGDEIKSLPDVPMAIDSTGVGDSVVEDIQKYKNDVEGFVFTPKSKQQLMVGLANAIQKRLIGFPEGVIRNELESFEYEYTQTGVRYSAINGKHDDAVCALALAWHKYQTAATSTDGPSVW